MEYIHQNYHIILLEEQKRLEKAKLRFEKSFLKKAEKMRKGLNDVKDPEKKELIEMLAEKMIAVLKRTLEKKKESLDNDLVVFEEDCKVVRDLLLQNPDPVGQKIFLGQADMGGIILEMGDLMTVEREVEDAGEVKYLYILGPKSKGEDDDFDIDAFEAQYP